MRRVFILFLAVVGYLLVSIETVQATEALNVPNYVKLAQDYLFSSTSETTALHTEVNITDDNTPILIQSVGSWYCQEGKKGVVSGYLAIDGITDKSNQLAMAFNNCPGQHPFLFHAAENLSKGTHSIELRVKVESGEIVAGISTNTVITVSFDFKDVGQWTINEKIIDSNDWQPVFSTMLPPSEMPRFVEFSGSLEAINEEGDAMTRIFLDDRAAGGISINDLLTVEDAIAPVSNQFLIPGDNNPHKLELRAARYFVKDVYENKVTFKLRPRGTLIVVTGDPESMKFFQLLPPDIVFFSPNETKTVLSTSISVPIGKMVNVLILVQGRWMSYWNAGYGNVQSWLELDGQKVSPIIYQYFSEGHSGSQRTFPTLALIKNVASGTHTVGLVVSAKNTTIPDLLIGAGSSLALITMRTSVLGDLNYDGKVDIFDYNLFVGNFGNTTCNNVADIDGNCKVDIFDYNILVENFGH